MDRKSLYRFLLTVDIRPFVLVLGIFTATWGVWLLNPLANTLSVSKAYAAWPTRLFLIGRDGRVAYAGDLGPYGFKPDELKAALDDYLASHP